MLKALAVRIKALRPFSFSASLVSVALGGAVSARSGAFDPAMFWVMVFVVLCLHMGTNLANDYFDFNNNIDGPGTLGSSGVLPGRQLAAKSVLRMMIISFGVALLLGTYIVSVRGWIAAVLGIIGMLGGFFYTAPPVEYKYHGWGDMQVFLLMGPVLVASTCIAVAGFVCYQAVLLSIPAGLLVMAVLIANNIRDFDFDRKAGIRTFAILIGLENSGREYKFAVLMPFLLVSLLAVLGVLNWLALLVWLTLPMAVSNIRKIGSNMVFNPAALVGIDAATAVHHLVFGLIVIVSVLVDVFWK